MFRSLSLHKSGKRGKQVRRFKQLIHGVCVALTMLVMSAGCGPVLYSVHVRPAERALEEAREAGAAEHAPYEYFYARAQLDKAREEAGQGDYQDAIDCAEEAEDFGVRARNMARRYMRESGR